MRRAAATVAALTALATVALPIPAFSPAPASAHVATQQRPRNCAQPGPVITTIPWQQRLLDPERIWPLTDGSGVTVAVLDSGVEAAHPQLTGVVERGADFLFDDGGGRADDDCSGHGTAVASIIAAQRISGVGFHGFAPGARILPVRISEEETAGDGDDDNTVSPSEFAEAIRWAADQPGVQVINLSVIVLQDHPDIAEAVQYALDRDIVIVAAVGNLYEEGNPTPYPAAYPGVIGVGAVSETLERVSESQVGNYVDLVAPGANIIAASRPLGHLSYTGTSFATAFVSATAALIRSYRPDWTAEQVAQQLMFTASPISGAWPTQQYGHGLLDPYRAVTEEIDPSGEPVAQPALSTPPPDPAVVAQQKHDAWTRRIALGIGGGILGLAVIIIAAAALLPRGRARRWRPGRYVPLPSDPPSLPAGITLFEKPPRQS